ncbi:MAG: hypothetical protein OXI40_11435 [Chloroflexota bacterium]|nr:hypothetical protein [Chloroflexota bacterium]
MCGSAKLRKDIVTLYLIVVTSILWLDQIGTGPPRSAEGELLFISDTDAIDAGRESNSVYRVALDDGGMKRILGSIPHGEGYLRISDIDCHAESGSLVIASGRHDLNGFHHALLDGSMLHLDRPASGRLLTSLQQIALAPDGIAVIVSRQYREYPQPRYGLVSGDLASRVYNSIKPPSPERSYLSPLWSPAGGSIAYIAVKHAPDAPPSYSLVIATPDGRGERVIYDTPLALTDIAWSPDGGWIAAVIGGQLHKLRPDGGDLTRLSHHPGGISGPRWSPDSRQISYVAPSSYPGFNQLMVMDADGGNIRRVANIRGEVVNGCWVSGASG